MDVLRSGYETDPMSYVGGVVVCEECGLEGALEAADLVRGADGYGWACPECHHWNVLPGVRAMRKDALPSLARMAREVLAEEAKA